MNLHFPLPEGDCKVIFDRSYGEPTLYQITTICVIKTSHKVVAGAAVKSPKDTDDRVAGFKLAFSRAVEQLYPHVAVPEFDTIPDVEYNRIYQHSKQNKDTRSVIWGFFLKELKKAQS